MNFFGYDLETMLNCFLFSGKFVDQDTIYTFEISPRMNQRDQLLAFLSYLRNVNATMYGYNVLNFDYPILHKLLNEPYTFTYETAYLEAQKIIHSQRGPAGRGLHQIKLQDRLIPQIDLMKIHHFDNRAKATSLKALQFAMRSESVEDLPFPFDTALTYQQMDIMRSYNVHDILESEQFFKKSYKSIQIRQELLSNGILSGDVLNFSDVKIGTEYLIKKIGRQRCFVGGGKPRQSFRDRIDFKDIILPKIAFRTPEFQNVLDWFRAQRILVLRQEPRPKLKASLGGLEFDFGVGGVHASVEKRRYHSNETHVIKDIDVSGMYVAVAIANQFSPEHLGDSFTVAYKQLQRDRAQHPKGSVMNLVLKLAGNGVFGNSNNDYSCFYDPKYTFSVTVNGQLQLCQLAEMLSLIPGLEMIQANTDGITVYMPRSIEPFFHLWCNEWECLTGLKLEHAEYKSMFIRDVNNYIAVDTKGKIKRKGAYWYPITEDDYHGSSGSNWNKDFSNLAAQKGAEQVLITGVSPADVVRCITDPFDFMLRYKTPGGSKLYIGDREQSKTVRYYVSTKGEPMRKVSPPKGPVGGFKRKNAITDEFYLSVLSTLPDGQWDERIHTKNKSRYETVTQSIESGFKVKNCNKASDFDWADVDWNYYTKEIEKLII